MKKKLGFVDVWNGPAITNLPRELTVAAHAENTGKTFARYCKSDVELTKALHDCAEVLYESTEPSSTDALSYADSFTDLADERDILADCGFNHETATDTAMRHEAVMLEFGYDLMQGDSDEPYNPDYL